MKKQPKKQAKVIQMPTPLSNEPIDYQMSVILQNMAATWGQEKVTAFFVEVFGQSIKNAKKKDKVA